MRKTSSRCQRDVASGCAKESGADEADGDGQGSQGSAAQEDVAAAEDREDEPVQMKPTQRRKNVHDLLALAASHSRMLL